MQELEASSAPLPSDDASRALAPASEVATTVDAPQDSDDASRVLATADEDANMASADDSVVPPSIIEGGSAPSISKVSGDVSNVSADPGTLASSEPSQSVPVTSDDASGVKVEEALPPLGRLHSGSRGGGGGKGKPLPRRLFFCLQLFFTEF